MPLSISAARVVEVQIPVAVLQLLARDRLSRKRGLQARLVPGRRETDAPKAAGAAIGPLIAKAGWPGRKTPETDDSRERPATEFQFRPKNRSGMTVSELPGRTGVVS